MNVYIFEVFKKSLFQLLEMLKNPKIILNSGQIIFWADNSLLLNNLFLTSVPVKQLCDLVSRTTSLPEKFTFYFLGQVM